MHSVFATSSSPVTATQSPTFALPLAQDVVKAASTAIEAVAANSGNLDVRRAWRSIFTISSPDFENTLARNARLCSQLNAPAIYEGGEGAHLIRERRPSATAASTKTFGTELMGHDRSRPPLRLMHTLPLYNSTLVIWRHGIVFPLKLKA